MLADAGCRYVLVGHSERRQGHGESDAVIRAKATAALDAGLVPVVCIGETEAEWQAGETLQRLGSQLQGSLPASAGGANVIVAYEPIWAIGTGRTPRLDDIAATHAFLRERLSETVTGGAAMILLYGGSVKPANAADILALANVDGALVGGASLDAADFLAIYKAGVGAAG
jgi:triosephosphate isomerase